LALEWCKSWGVAGVKAASPRPPPPLIPIKVLEVDVVDVCAERALRERFSPLGLALAALARQENRRYVHYPPDQQVVWVSAQRRIVV
jgi:hypothetical protein